MKKKLLLFNLFLCGICYCQKLPFIASITSTEISGTAEAGTTILIDADNNGTFNDYIILVNASGIFKQTFTTSIPVGSIINIKSAINKEGTQKETKSMSLQILDPTTLPVGAASTGALSVVKHLDAKNTALANTILIYKATISNTNFTIPIARFNFTKNTSDNAKGNISLFTSIGAGVGISWGRMEITRDNEGQIVNEEYSNTVGFHIGALFSSGTGEDTKNVFAPTLNFSVLDFQVGAGYELGTIQENQRRVFVTISYAIPLYKLVRKSYRIWNIDPYPIASRRGSNLN